MFVQFKGNNSMEVMEEANKWEKENVGKIHVSHHAMCAHKGKFIIVVHYEEISHS